MIGGIELTIGVMRMRDGHHGNEIVPAAPARTVNGAVAQLVQEPAAVDEQGLAGDERAFVGDKEGERAQ